MQFALKTKESAKKIWQILLFEVQKGLFYKDLLDRCSLGDQPVSEPLMRQIRQANETSVAKKNLFVAITQSD